MNRFLETERTYLGEFGVDDAELLFDLDSDPEVMRYLTGGVPSTREEVAEALQRILALYQKHAGKFGLWKAEEKATSRFIGWFILRPSHTDPENTKRIEIGYRLKREFWGNGYATEVSRALVSKAFDEFDVDEVFGTSMKEHAASQRVMEKCGLSFVREFVYDEPPGPVTLDVEYSLGRSDYLRNRSGSVRG